MDVEDFEPLDPAPAVKRLQAMVQDLRPHIGALVPEGPTVRAETAIVYEDGFRVELSMTVRLRFPTDGSA